MTTFSFKETSPLTVKKLDKQIGNADKKLNNRSVLNKKVSIFLDQWVQQNFKTEGGNVGGWPPFKHGGRVNSKGLGTQTRIYTGSTTIEVYVDKSAKLLQDTGRLRISFAPFSTQRDAGIGSDLPYSKFHNEGEGHLPRRRMLPKKYSDRDLIKKCTQIYNGYIQESFK